MKMSKKGEFIRLAFICVVLMVIGCVVSLLSEEELNLASIQAVITIGIWLTLAIILVLICTVCYVISRDVDYKKLMEKHQQKNSYNLRKIGYFMIPSNAKMKPLLLTIFLPRMIFLIMPFYDQINTYLRLCLAISCGVLACVVLVKIWGKSREKTILENTIRYFKGDYTSLKEKLDLSIQNDMLFKDKHLVVTKEFFICENIAIPINQIEKFYLMEVKPNAGDVISLLTTRQACLMRLVCVSVNGKRIGESMGVSKLEICNIKDFFKYYSGINLEISEKYEGVK